MLLSERIIILRTISYSEADLIVQGLSEKGSGISLLARGAKKSRKRFCGGVLEPTHFIKITYRGSKDERGLNILNEALLLEDFIGIREDYDRLQASLFFLKVVNKVSSHGLVDSHGVFILLGQTLRTLETSNSFHNLKIHFLSQLLSEQGVFPEKQDTHLLEESVDNHKNIDTHYGRKWNAYVHLMASSAHEYLGTDVFSSSFIKQE